MHEQPSFYEVEFRRRGEIGLQLTHHRLAYSASGITRTVECCMVSEILDSTLSPTIFPGDLLVSITFTNSGEESPCINNDVPRGMTQFAHIMQMMTNSMIYPNRTLRFLRAPQWCYKEGTNTTTLRHVLDHDSACLIFDPTAITMEAARSPPSSPSGYSHPSGKIIAPIISPIQSPKIAVKSLKVKSKDAWKKEQESMKEFERSESIKTAEIIGDEVQRQLDQKNRAVQAELLRVRQEAEQSQFEAFQLAEEMKLLAETKRRRLAELTRKEIESQALEYARHQVAQEEMVGRHAIAEKHERMHQESERRVFEDQQRQVQSEETAINRMLDHQSAVMNATFTKAQMELLAAEEDARRAQEELRAVEASVMFSTQRIRMEEERKQLEMQQEAMKTETMKIEQAKRLAAVELSCLLEKQKQAELESRTLLEAERALIEQETMKIEQAKQLAADELNRLTEQRKQAELESRALLETKETLAVELHRLNVETQRRMEAQALETAQLELLAAEEDARRAQEELRAVEASVMFSTQRIRMDEERKQLEMQQEAMKMETMKIEQAKQLAADELNRLTEQRKQAELESRELLETKETLAVELHRLNVETQRRMDEERKQLELEARKLQEEKELLALERVTREAREAAAALAQAERALIEQETLKIEQAKQMAADELNRLETERKMKTQFLLTQEVALARQAEEYAMKARDQEEAFVRIALEERIRALETERIQSQALQNTLQEEAKALVAAERKVSKELDAAVIDREVAIALKEQAESTTYQAMMRLASSDTMQQNQDADQQLSPPQPATPTVAEATESDYEITRRMILLRGENEPSPIGIDAASNEISNLNNELQQEQQVQRTDDSFVVCEQVSWWPHTSAEMDDESCRSLPPSTTAYGPPQSLPPPPLPPPPFPPIARTQDASCSPVANSKRVHDSSNSSDQQLKMHEVGVGPDSPLTNNYSIATNPRRITREVAVVLTDAEMNTDASPSQSASPIEDGVDDDLRNEDMHSDAFAIMHAKEQVLEDQRVALTAALDATAIHMIEEEKERAVSELAQVKAELFLTQELMKLRTVELMIREKSEAMIEASKRKTEIVQLVHGSADMMTATVGNDGDDDVDIDVFSASDRDRLTEYERNKRKSDLAEYDRNKRIEEAVKYRVDLQVEAELAEDRNRRIEEAVKHRVDSRVESEHAEYNLLIPSRTLTQEQHSPVTQSSRGSSTDNNRLHRTPIHQVNIQIIEDQDEQKVPLMSVADKVRAEARRLQLRAKEVDLRRKQLLVEQDRIQIIDVQCQATLEEAARQIEDATTKLAIHNLLK